MKAEEADVKLPTLNIPVQGYGGATVTAVQRRLHYHRNQGR
jgi:hypothetical protein